MTFGYTLRQRISTTIAQKSVMAPVGRSVDPDYSDHQILGTDKQKKSNEVNDYKLQIVWRNVILMAFLHIGAIYGAYLMITVAKYQTVIAWFLFYMCSGLGITVGAHRLWAHRSFRANFALRALLVYFNTMAVQNDIYDWSRDHRVHHKFSETDADPHNANRGFFFSHIGWLLCRKHPEVLSKGKNVDLSDLLADPLVRFQRKYYKLLIIIATVIIPTLIPYLCWSETLYNSFYICVLFRYCYTLNCTWLINSVAHMYGNRPYDTSITPRENYFATIQTMGEGYHNYHHTFPWDYSASELDWKYNWNFSTLFIDFFARIGWAYDRKKVSSDMIGARVKRTGDKQLTATNGQQFYQLFIGHFIGFFVGMTHLWMPFLIRFLISL